MTVYVNRRKVICVKRRLFRVNRSGPVPQPYCGRGHLNIPENRYKNGSCKLCAVDVRKAWYRAHKDQHKALMKKWNEANPGRLNELQREWYVRNRADHNEKSRQWSAAHLALKAHYRRTRRTLVVSAKGFATPEQVVLRMEYFGNRCSYCDDGLFEEVDHAVPLSRGGTNWPANLRPACQSCNRRKHAKTIWEFLGIDREKVAA